MTAPVDSQMQVVVVGQQGSTKVEYSLGIKPWPGPPAWAISVSLQGAVKPVAEQGSVEEES
jgi:hypothetical protein